MKTASEATTAGRVEEIAARVGAERVIEPEGALPQGATRLDPAGPVRPFELEVAVERLCLDSTSHREIRERCGADPGRMADRILEIVAARGKLHNPATDSGGVLLGTVLDAGAAYPSPPAPGERIATLASLTVTPLRLERIAGLDPDSPQSEVAGTAYLFERMAWAPVPEDMPAERALELFDVCAAASHTRALAGGAEVVCVLGAGHAGKLAMAAARDAMGGGLVVAVDVDDRALAAASDAGLCDVAVAADLRQPVAALEAIRAAGVPPADLVVVVVNASGCEPAALLLADDEGTVLFFSMATAFQRAALSADGLGSPVRMLVGSGFSPDRGEYALRLVRGSEPLRHAFGIAAGSGA
jgi:L-erythro-3,5-diaminohexanoate dehydrogenase